MTRYLWLHFPWISQWSLAVWICFWVSVGVAVLWIVWLALGQRTSAWRHEKFGSAKPYFPGNYITAFFASFVPFLFMLTILMAMSSPLVTFSEQERIDRYYDSAVRQYESAMDILEASETALPFEKCWQARVSYMKFYEIANSDKFSEQQKSDAAEMFQEWTETKEMKGC